MSKADWQYLSNLASRQAREIEELKHMLRQVAGTNVGDDLGTAVGRIRQQQAKAANQRQWDEFYQRQAASQAEYDAIMDGPGSDVPDPGPALVPRGITPQRRAANQRHMARTGHYMTAGCCDSRPEDMSPAAQDALDAQMTIAEDLIRQGYTDGEFEARYAAALAAAGIEER